MSMMVHGLSVLVQMALVMSAQPKPMLEGHTDNFQGSVDDVLDIDDLQNTTLGFMVGLPQNAKTFSTPTHNPRHPQERVESGRGQRKNSLSEFQNEERIRLLNFLLDLDTAGANIASFQAQERARLRSFQDQERARFQVEKHALRSFQAQEKMRLKNMVRSLDTVGQSLESFQDQERFRFQGDLQAFALFQDQERLRLQSLGRAIDAINATVSLKGPFSSSGGDLPAAQGVSEAPLPQTAADLALEASPASHKSELLSQISLDVTCENSLMLMSIVAISSVAFAVLRSRRSVSAAAKEPLLV